MGGTTILYVVYGGNRSVIWTDVVQMALIWFGIFVCVGVAIAQLPAGPRACATRWRSRRPRGGSRSMDTLARPHAALHALERAHRRHVPGDGVLRLRPEPGAALPVRPQPDREPPVAALQRLPQGADAVPDPADRRAGLRLLPLPRSRRSLWNAAELRAARGARAAGRARARCAARPRRRTPRASAAAAAFAARPRRRRSRAPAREAYRRPHRERLAARARPRCAGSRRSTGRHAVQRHQLHLPDLRGLAAARRPGRPGDRGDLRGRDVDAVAASSTRSPPRRWSTSTSASGTTARATRTTCWSRACSRRSGASSRASWRSQAGRLGSAIEVVNRFGSYFYGSILGVFGLAVLTPRASARGAFYGLLAGMTAVFLVVPAHEHCLPLVQRRRRADRVRSRARDHGRFRGPVGKARRKRITGPRTTIEAACAGRAGSRQGQSGTCLWRLLAAGLQLDYEAEVENGFQYRYGRRGGGGGRSRRRCASPRRRPCRARSCCSAIRTSARAPSSTPSPGCARPSPTIRVRPSRSCAAASRTAAS